jgi:hypothetical protein
MHVALRHACVQGLPKALGHQGSTTHGLAYHLHNTCAGRHLLVAPFTIYVLKHETTFIAGIQRVCPS